MAAPFHFFLGERFGLRRRRLTPGPPPLLANFSWPAPKFEPHRGWVIAQHLRCASSYEKGRAEIAAQRALGYEGLERRR